MFARLPGDVCDKGIVCRFVDVCVVCLVVCVVDCLLGMREMYRSAAAGQIQKLLQTAQPYVLAYVILYHSIL